MNSLARFGAYALSGCLPVALVLSTDGPPRSGPGGHFSPSAFPNLPLRTHEAKEVRFYDDLLKGKVVVLHFFYTRCDGVCPRSVENLLEVQRILGERVGRDVFLYSISLKPDEDPPERLAAYAKEVGAGPGWTFLTGEGDVVERLRRGLGFVDPDPEADKDKSQHVGMVLFGNEARQSWVACPGGSSPELMAEQILWMVPSPEERAGGGGPTDPDRTPILPWRENEVKPDSRRTLWVAAALAAAAPFAGAQTTSSQQPPTLTQISLVPPSVAAAADFEPGGMPEALAYDGTHVWVARQFANSVAKIHATNGSISGTFPVGNRPLALAYDGSHVWVANFGDDNVQRLQTSDGAVVSTVPVAGGPGSLAFGGGILWVASRGGNSVTKIQASTSAVLGTFPVGRRPIGMAIAGNDLWVANNNDDTVTRLRASDGVTLGTVGVGKGPIGVAYDGTRVWVSNFFSNTVTKIQASTGATLATYAVGDSPVGVVYDGQRIRVANSGSQTVMRLRVNDGVVLSTVQTGKGPFGLLWTGSAIWAANTGGDSVSTSAF